MALRADDVDLGRDRDLVVRSQSGDDGAFEDLYRRYFDRLYRFCLRRVGDPHEAEELAQETFARAYGALPRLAGERRFYPWLSVIASRLCVDEYRRRARSEPAAVIDLGVGEGGQERILQEVDTELLERAMTRLTARHQDVLRLREHEGWSYQHIAEHMGVNLGTVEALLHRARRALRREFDVLAGPERVPVAVGGGMLAALGRRLRARVAQWESTWVPVVGNAMAAAAVVVGSAVSVGAPAGASTVGTSPALSPIAAMTSASGASNASETTAPASASTDHRAPEAAVAPVASPRGEPARSRSPVPEPQTVEVKGADGRDRSEDQPVVVQVLEKAILSADPEAVADDSGQRLEKYGDDAREELP